MCWLRVSPNDPNAEFSHHKPIDRHVVSCHGNSEITDCVATQVDPLRGSLGPSMYIEEQCVCERAYTVMDPNGQLLRFGYPEFEAKWLNPDGTMSKQVRCIPRSSC